MKAVTLVKDVFMGVTAFSQDPECLTKRQR